MHWKSLEVYYFDTDVEVIKDFAPLLDQEAFADLKQMNILIQG
mgnify:CR=1 FL=1